MNCELCGLEGPHPPWIPRCPLVRCNRCRLVFYDSSVNDPSLYSGNYFRTGEYWDYPSEKWSLQLNFQRRVRQLLKRVSPGGELLEIGCAYGFFLEVAHPYWRVQGIDITSEGIQFARERLHLEVQCEEFLSLPERPERYDIICLWDTIEHLSHPVRTVEKAARWLKPGGVLALSTGDIESGVARWRGAKWRQIHPPTHLYYFSPKTLTMAFEQAGLRTEAIERPGQFRNFKAIAYKFLSANDSHRSLLYRLVTFGDRLDFPIYLNLFDLMVAFARKPGNLSQQKR